MLDGKRPMKYCNYCFNAEDKFDQESPRHHKNYQFITNNFDDVRGALESTTADGTIEFKLRYYDIRFSNICNLKCRTCGPDLSSTWAAETHAHSEHGLSNYPLIKKNGIIKINDISKNILDEILEDDTLKSLRQVYFAGGEPLVSGEHYKILEGLIRVGNTDVKLMYNTNFTKLAYAGTDVLDLWSHFPYLHVGTSIDDVGARLFYTRSGAIWQDVVENFKQFNARINDSQLKIYNSITVSIFNIFYLPEIISQFYELNLVSTRNDFSIHLNMVFDPEYFAVTTLPAHVKPYITSMLTDFVQRYDFKNEKLKVHIQDKMQYVIDLMNSKDTSSLLPIMAEKIAEFDLIRNEDFANVFPEANKYLKLEQYVNNHS